MHYNSRYIDQIEEHMHYNLKSNFFLKPYSSQIGQHTQKQDYQISSSTKWKSANEQRYMYIYPD
jgi:RNA-binding protein YlmH